MPYPTKTPREGENVKLQVFTPSRVQAVVDDTYTPEDSDLAFFIQVAANVVITPEGEDPQTQFTLAAYLPIGILEGATYSFPDSDVTVVVVM